MREYLEDISRIETMDAAEEVALTRRVRQGDAAARREMIARWLPYVVFLAKQRRSLAHVLEDVVAQGNLGLIRAVDGFDPELGYRFSTYARYWINQAMQRWLENGGRSMIRVPVWVRKGQATGVKNKERRLAEAQAAARAVERIVRIDGLGMADGNASYPLPGHRDEAYPIIEHRAEAWQEHERDEDTDYQIVQIAQQLEQREWEIVRLYYGIGCERPHMLKEIGQIHGISRECVRQIISKAIHRLRRGHQAAALAS